MAGCDALQGKGGRKDRAQGTIQHPCHQQGGIQGNPGDVHPPERHGQISENEGANFWLQVLTDLNNRDLQDILIACTDNLKGFTEAILGIFPKTQVQKCFVHQIRNSLKYIASKDQKEFM